MPTYQIVTPGRPDHILPDRAALDAWIARAGLEVTGAVPEWSPGVLAVPHPPEIVGQPRLRGIAGPMKNGPGVARYELPHDGSTDRGDLTPVDRAALVLRVYDPTFCYRLRACASAGRCTANPRARND